jgi:TDG/mug DNA glycosylase family protein
LSLLLNDNAQPQRAEQGFSSACGRPSARTENKVGRWIAGASLRKFGLPIVADDMTKVLVMGTLPSDISLLKGQYYANPANDFWRLMGAVLNQNVEALSYEQKLSVLKIHRIGLWDAYHNCIRPGSLDSDITQPELNDFSILRTTAPDLHLVCFNGKEAAKSDGKLRFLEYKTCVLPSSSGANRKNSAERVHLWESMIGASL